MGSPKEEAYGQRFNFMRDFRHFVQTPKKWHASCLLDSYRDYLQHSGIVRSYDKPLVQQYWGIEFQESMKEWLTVLKLDKKRAFMVKMRIPHSPPYAYSVLLDRTKGWFLLRRTESCMEPGKIPVGLVEYFENVSTQQLLESCWNEKNQMLVDFVARFLTDSCYHLSELAQQKARQAIEVNDEAVTIGGLCELL